MSKIIVICSHITFLVLICLPQLSLCFIFLLDQHQLIIYPQLSFRRRPGPWHRQSPFQQTYTSIPISSSSSSQQQQQQQHGVHSSMTAPSSSSTFTCTNCLNTFSSRNALFRHVRQNHSPIDENRMNMKEIKKISCIIIYL